MLDKVLEGKDTAQDTNNNGKRLCFDDKKKTNDKYVILHLYIRSKLEQKRRRHLSDIMNEDSFQFDMYTCKDSMTSPKCPPLFAHEQTHIYNLSMLKSQRPNQRRDRSSTKWKIRRSWSTLRACKTVCRSCSLHYTSGRSASKQTNKQNISMTYRPRIFARALVGSQFLSTWQVKVVKKKG